MATRWKQQAQADKDTIAKVVAWLNNEHGAISAQVSLPSGRNVTVFKDGTVKGA